MSASTNNSPISVTQSPTHLPDVPNGFSITCQSQNQPRDDPWIIPSSTKSIRAANPVSNAIERLVKNIKLGPQRADLKNPISLAHGDPTTGENLPHCTIAMEVAISASLHQPRVANYASASGTQEARQAIAVHHSYPEHRIGPEEVIVSSGCSGALEIALTSLLDPGTVLLVPQPSFPLYQMIAESHGATVVHYRLRRDTWECDMTHLQDLMIQYQNVRAIVINNPSGATGTVFSELHLVNLLDFALVHRLPIVSDEVFGDMTFGSKQFYPLAQVAAKTRSQVPILTTSGLSKQFLLSGWRVGWLTFHDNLFGSLREVKVGSKRLAHLTSGASQLAQSAIPKLLSSTTPGLVAWKQNLNTTLERQAVFFCTKISLCNGLEPVVPQGTFYALVKIDYSILEMDDWEFSTRLLEEENLIVLPGSAIGAPRDVFRISFHLPEKSLYVAAHRLSEFCRRHSRKQRVEEFMNLAML